MAGKKKAGRAKSGRSPQVQQHQAGSMGNMPSTAPADASSMVRKAPTARFKTPAVQRSCSNKSSSSGSSYTLCRLQCVNLDVHTALLQAQAAADPQGGHSIDVSRTAGDTANTAGTSLEGASDALAELHINRQGCARIAASKQLRGRQGRGVQAHVLKAASSTGGAMGTVAQAPALSASELVAQLNSSSDVSIQAGLLQQISTMATTNQEQRSALLAAGIIPALLRLEQSSSRPVCGDALSAVMQLLCITGVDRETKLVTCIIPQIVPMVRHQNKDMQYMALWWLAESAYESEAQAKLIVAAGAIPAVTEALHRGQDLARLTAASLLVQLATVGGMGIDTALAGVVPVALSALECGTPENQLEAVCLLDWWAMMFKSVNTMAVVQDSIPTMVQLLGGEGLQTQQAAAALLTKFMCHGGKTQAAVREGAIPALIQLLHSTDQHVRLFGANALQHILTECSQAANMAAAAGAIKPLVSMLACGNGGKQWVADSDVGVGATIPPCSFHAFKPVAKEQWQATALSGLCSIAAADHQHCTAIVAAGAVPAITAAVDNQGEVHHLALDTLKHLCANDSTGAAVATHIVEGLHNSKVLTQEVWAKVAVSQLYLEDRFRPAFLAAGGVAAMMSLLGQETDPFVVKWAASTLRALVRGPVEAAALVEAGAIVPLAQLLQDSSAADTRKEAAHALVVVAVFHKVHDPLAEVIPQLLQVMHDNDACLHGIVGSLLQTLAHGQEASLLRAFRATKHQWQPLLASSCSEAQRYAAGAMYYFVLDGDCQGCSEGIKTLFKSMRWIHPAQRPSQWKPMISAETCVQL